jgi:hypothetical protein
MPTGRSGRRSLRAPSPGARTADAPANLRPGRASLLMLGGSPQGRLAGEKGFGVAARTQRPSPVAARRRRGCAPSRWRERHRGHACARCPGPNTSGVVGRRPVAGTGMDDRREATPRTSGGVGDRFAARAAGTLRPIADRRAQSWRCSRARVETTSAGRALRTDAGGECCGVRRALAQGELWVAEAENRDGKAKRREAQPSAPAGSRRAIRHVLLKPQDLSPDDHSGADALATGNLPRPSGNGDRKRWAADPTMAPRRRQPRAPDRLRNRTGGPRSGSSPERYGAAFARHVRPWGSPGPADEPSAADAVSDARVRRVTVPPSHGG